MPDKNISELTDIPALIGTEELALERGASNYKATVEDLKQFIDVGRNIDGGSPSSVYTAEQGIDGGGV
tara:strand:- start:78 stop:281 length:204 start_codon:yes stop_codon:yes gene_type:complete